MERRDVFENWFRFFSRDTDTNSIGSRHVDAAFESSSKSTRHHSNNRVSTKMDFELESSSKSTRHHSNNRVSTEMDFEFESSSKSTRHHSNNRVNTEMDFEFESSSKFTGHDSRKRNTHSSRGNVRDISASKCQRLAGIIGGMVISAAPVCVVMRLRNIKATILGRRTRSPLALPFMLSFENNGLNLGESVVLQKEINPLISALRKRGIIVTAVHNHWLFDNPRLMYMHWENVGMTPEEFAKNSIAAAREAGLF